MASVAQRYRARQLALASIKEVQGPKLKASAKSLHSALKLAADQASRSGDQSTAADYADAAGKMTGVIRSINGSSS